MSNRLKIAALAAIALAFLNSTKRVHAQSLGQIAARAAVGGAAAYAGWNLGRWLFGQSAQTCWQYRNCGMPPWASNAPGYWQYGPTVTQTVWIRYPAQPQYIAPAYGSRGFTGEKTVDIGNGCTRTDSYEGGIARRWRIHCPAWQERYARVEREEYSQQREEYHERHVVHHQVHHAARAKGCSTPISPIPTECGDGLAGSREGHQCPPIPPPILKVLENIRGRLFVNPHSQTDLHEKVSQQRPSACCAWSLQSRNGEKHGRRP